MTCGKGLTGGYLPLSAVLAREEVYDAFLGAPSEARTFFHGHSYTANPLCCAAAIANLDLMAERGTVEHAARVGERIGELTKGLEAYDGVREVRRVGTMTGHRGRAGRRAHRVRGLPGGAAARVSGCARSATSSC